MLPLPGSLVLILLQLVPLQSSVISPSEFLVGLERDYMLLLFADDEAKANSDFVHNHTARMGQGCGLKCGFIFPMVSASLCLLISEEMDALGLRR